MAARIELPPIEPSLGVHAVFLSTPREEVIYVKVLLESYEGVASYRTQNPEHEPGRALIAVLVAPDFARDATAVLEAIAATTGAVQHTAGAAELTGLQISLEPGDEPGR
jgi:hypothetical protein